MPKYRMTVRHGRPHRYHVEDITADTLRDALRLAADAFPDAASSADLLEIRLQADAERREYAAEG